MMIFKLEIFAIFFGLTSITFKVVLGYPYKLQCSRSMVPGSIIMGNPVKEDAITRYIIVKRDGVILPSGSRYKYGETLSVEVSDANGEIKYMLQTVNGILSSGANRMCNNQRAYNTDGTVGDYTIQMPTLTQVNGGSSSVFVWVGWATGYGHVYTTSNFTLIDPSAIIKPSVTPSFSPSVSPTKSVAPTSYTAESESSPLFTATSVAASDVNTQYYTLVLRREILSGLTKPMITVNHTIPGPVLRAKLGQWIHVTVINEMGDDVGTMHWHGMDMRDTPFNDGPIGLTQCAINFKNFSSSHNINSLSYLFKPDRTGTYWYHGHHNEQYVDGQYGMLIVEDDFKTVAAYAAKGVQIDSMLETQFMIADWHNESALALSHWYMSAESHGNEPTPDAIIVNSHFSRTMKIGVSRNQPVRIRIVNAAALSMFTFSVDGLPLKLIEVDGTPLEPIDFASVTLNAAQRVSVILDWSRLNSTISASTGIYFRVHAVPTMYRTYDKNAPYMNLYGTANKQPFNIHYQGLFSFTGESTSSSSTVGIGAVVSYQTSRSTNPTQYCSYPEPTDSNILEARSLFPDVAPSSDLLLSYVVTFDTNPITGVKYAAVNGKSYNNIYANASHPMLYDYILNYQGGAFKEAESYPMQSMISGDGEKPFVIPYNRVVDVMINNTDGGAHPMHLHGHSFWVVKTSAGGSSAPPLRRDVVTVPALGWVVIRFVSDNPGVWMLHCHIDWHMKAGFIATIIEAPSVMTQLKIRLPVDHSANCGNPNIFTATPSRTPTVAPSSPTFTPTVMPSSPTVKPSCAPSFRPSVREDYYYIGCYGDATPRAMNKIGDVSSLQACYSIAIQYGYTYFALQYSTECYGSKDFSSATQYGLCGASNTGSNKYCTCTMPCKNGIDLLCGGGLGNALYKINLSAKPTAAPTTTAAPSFTASPTNLNTNIYDWTTDSFNKHRSGLNPHIKYISADTPFSFSRIHSVALIDNALGQPVVVLDYPVSQDELKCIAYVGDRKGYFYAVDVKVGSILWQVNTGYTTQCGELGDYGIIGAATFNRTAESVYIMSSKAVFYAFDMATGSVRWSIENAYDPTYNVNYGALLNYDQNIYMTLASYCDFGDYNGAVLAISTVTRKVIYSYNPSGVAMGGGIWGITGVALGQEEIPTVNTKMYFSTGNCLKGAENSMDCEAIVQLDSGLNRINAINPVKSAAGDNDMGAGTAIINLPKDGQTSGCKRTLVTGARKDGRFYVLDAKTMTLIQTLILSEPTGWNNLPVVSWDPTTNMAMYPQAGDWYEYSTKGIGYPRSIMGLELNATCNFNLKWMYPLLSGPYLLKGTIVGPPMNRVYIIQVNYELTALKVGNGELMARTAQFAPLCAGGPAIVGDMIVMACSEGSTGKLFVFKTVSSGSNLLLAPSLNPVTMLPTKLPATMKPSIAPILVPTAHPVTFIPSFVFVSVTPSISPVTSTATSTRFPINNIVSSSYLGCFRDGNFIRAMATRLPGTVDSVAACRDLAVVGTDNNSWQYFAIQYGRECWVSNSLAEATQYGTCSGSQCECAMLCFNGETQCGGPMANSLYEVVFTSAAISTTTAPTVTPLSSLASISIAPFATTTESPSSIISDTIATPSPIISEMPLPLVSPRPTIGTTVGGGDGGSGSPKSASSGSGTISPSETVGIAIGILASVGLLGLAIAYYLMTPRKVQQTVEVASTTAIDVDIK